MLERLNAALDAGLCPIVTDVAGNRMSIGSLNADTVGATINGGVYVRWPLAELVRRLERGIFAAVNF